MTITIKNNATGETKDMESLQEVANHLATAEFPGDWVGFEQEGELPDPRFDQSESDDADLVDDPIETEGTPDKVEQEGGGELPEQAQDEAD